MNLFFQIAKEFGRLMDQEISETMQKGLEKYAKPLLTLKGTDPEVDKEGKLGLALPRNADPIRALASIAYSKWRGERVRRPLLKNMSVQIIDQVIDQVLFTQDSSSHRKVRILQKERDSVSFLVV